MAKTTTYAVAAVIVIAIIGVVLYYESGMSTNPYSYTNPASTSSASTSSASTSSSSTTATYTAAISSSATLGKYLIDSNGMTLYYFKSDTVSTTSPVSACTSSTCKSTWPAFYASSITVPSGLISSDFTAFTRSDGSMQTAYKGMPLYHYSGDSKAGDTSGQGIGNLWYVVAP